ncbi:MAG: NlpC/P60 family protein [Nitriliruptor sp.]
MSLRRALTALTALLSFALIGTPAAATTTSFSDVSGSPHEASVHALAAEGLVQGCEDSRYCPDAQLTRGQVATILFRALELEVPVETHSDGEPVEPRFTDTADSVHHEAIEAIAEAGVTSGCGEGRFCPGDAISRGELATLLVRALELPAATDGPHFLDTNSAHGPAVDAMAEAGLTAGCDLVRFCSTSQLSRAHAATFLARGLELVEQAELAPFAERQAEHERQLAEAQAEADAKAKADAEAAAKAEAEADARAAAPGQKAVEVALAQVGKPYKWGGTGPSSFDCSGLTGYAWRAAGVTLPRVSRDQYSGTQRINRGDLRPGDLVFYHSPISHVAMYIGDGKVVEAPSSGKYVRVSSTGLSRSGIVGYGRPR